MLRLLPLLCLPLLAQDAFLSRVRQVTFEGRRAGESYFHPSGRFMVFQSERESENPFYQIYLMDLEAGSTRRISPGLGKTTCAWLHPTREEVLFASTHGDPASVDLMKQELEMRRSGKARRYAWDYDPHFDLYLSDTTGGGLVQLTSEHGYDAEGSFSPDGSLIVYASNHHAYHEPLTVEEQGKLEQDPSFFIELYSLVPGARPRRLTHMPGYDGGPFFSPDGQQVCFRHFSEDGAVAEIWTMNIDGTQARALTSLGAMSWAPFYHPSGAYLIFTTNLQGFANFELYLVDAAGTREPVRVTDTAGFDGLPVFFPDGQRLAWTSNRSADKSSQIFFAEWDHAAALAALAKAPLRMGNAVQNGQQAQASDDEALPETQATLASRLDSHIRTLAQPAWQGRLTGSPGERSAGEYLAQIFQNQGLQPLPGQKDFFQEFEFPAGVSYGLGNRLSWQGQARALDQQWRPIALSRNGAFAGELVFAGYGLSLAAEGGQEAYDSFVHLELKDRWVMVLRYLPEQVDEARRDFLRRHATLREKAAYLRKQGALGMVVVSGPHSGVREDLVPLGSSGAGSGGLAVVSISDGLASEMLRAAGRDLADLQAKLDRGELVQGFPLGRLEAEIQLVTERRKARNVLARLGVNSDLPPLLIGAHYDHLGDGSSGNSLAREEQKGLPHLGADDNASGTAALLELARLLATQKDQLRRDVWFAAFSGEELGLLGSAHFAERLAAPGHSLEGKVQACLNLDMVGRLRETLLLQGLGSSEAWSGLVEQVNVAAGLPLQTSQDCYLPTDATSFYLRRVPILSAFTGAHADYHTPADTPDRINLQGLSEITRFMGRMASQLALAEKALPYREQEPPKNRASRGGFRVYLGTIPDYAQSESGGVRLSGVTKNGPAEKAGLLAGDLLVEVAGQKVENIYDYTHVLEGLKPGQSSKVSVLRQGQRLEFAITPGSRD